MRGTGEPRCVRGRLRAAGDPVDGRSGDVEITGGVLRNKRRGNGLTLSVSCWSVGRKTQGRAGFFEICSETAD